MAICQAVPHGPPKCILGDILQGCDTNITYDYVVIGGGTAGATIAMRLAEQSFSVALVEAGSHYESQSLAALPIADVLPTGSDPTTSASIDWGFVTKGQPGANKRDIHFARGKCLGGSSALNFMIYQRPTTESMQQWVDAVDDYSYAFDQVFPYYKKSTAFTPPNKKARFPNATVEYEPSAFDATGGPLQVSYSNYAMPFSTWMLLGMEAIGINKTNDFNSGSLFGAQYCTSTIRPSDESRSSSESSFLASANFGSLLHIYTSTLAKKILFNGEKQATGVEVSSGFSTFQLTANKEVILSAGAFQSPQLLMVSGIGPSESLQRYDIEVISDLPGVGQNMWDHPFFAPTYRVGVETLTEIANNVLNLGAEFLEYETSHAGIIASPISDFLAWEKIPNTLRANFSSETTAALSWFSDDWPEAEYISGAGYIGNVSNLFAIQPKDGYQYASILGVLVAPTSRGNVTITSNDTSNLPTINPNWLATETDQQVSIAMFRRIRAAFQSKEMAPIIVGDEYYPGNDVQTDEEILQFIKNNLMTLWHPAGTCKMGTEDDSMAVINSKAQVLGVERLRVVDASSFPILPPGHPQSTVYMLAEKIADEIVRGL
ncbi:choline dehydrogenase and related flavoproteins [Talaromyces islandicus]|uniref:Choline dehydrogenase and related flavoproteins n=1 Tax=Talaromyces islandicus TaxID=28573 RepID=A0A0U1LKL3_TALIS|nr:choline dehydrogenase and related flavoproteins [Talaromyces islandicus]